jgi:hypothetical protein
VHPARLTALDHIYQVLLVWKCLGVQELLAELGKGNVVDIASCKGLVLETKAGSVNLVCKDLIGASVVLVGLNGFTSGGTSLLYGHTLCYTTKDDSLGDISTIVSHVIS